VRDGERCLKLDTTTGQLVHEFIVPSTPDAQTDVWGYIACVDGVLYGTAADQQHIVTYRYRDTTGDMDRLLTESSRLFAMDASTGDVLWQYEAVESIRHNAIAIGGGRVYLIDRPQALFDRLKKPVDKQHSMGTLIALDAKTGEQQWSRAEDIYGTMLSLSDTHGVLLMSYQPTRFRLDSEIGGQMTAFDASSGTRRWKIEADYQSRPMINDDRIYAQGGAWNLLSGEPIPFAFKRSYGCGILAASRRLLVFRSATLGYCDLEQNAGVRDYGGIRPGCWVNTLPAGGLVLLPDATAGCRCSYLNRSWIALVPMD
jgi:outer membrane protein assembly factor BamB